MVILSSALGVAGILAKPPFPLLGSDLTRCGGTQPTVLDSNKPVHGGLVIYERDLSICRNAAQ